MWVSRSPFTVVLTKQSVSVVDEVLETRDYERIKFSRKWTGVYLFICVGTSAENNGVRFSFRVN